MAVYSKSLKVKTTVFIGLLLAGIGFWPVQAIANSGMPATPDHSAWTAMLQEYVAENGNVNYASFKKDRQQLADYLDYLQGMGDKVTSWPREEQLAYYINLYNAATVNLILENYPLASILDIEKPFDQKLITLGDREISLSQLENDILRNMDEPRIHFAINCASFSCPKLLNRAFEADTLEQQLEKVTREFINDPDKNSIGDNRLKLSHIFKWYRADFTGAGSLAGYIDRYTKDSINEGASIEFLEYDWSLNDTR